MLWQCILIIQTLISQENPEDFSRHYSAFLQAGVVHVFTALKGTHFLYFNLPSLQLVLCSVAAVKRLPVHQP